MSLFINTLKDTYNLSAEVGSFLLENTTTHHYHKKTLLLDIGQTCDRLFFVEKGLARGFYKYFDKDITSWFVKEGEFIYSPYSFLRQKPSKEGVELLEDATVATISYATLQYIYNTYPQTNEIGRRITEEYLLLYDERVQDLRHHKVIDRLEAFINKYPDIYARAPHHHIASFLGTDATGMSRVLGQKHKK
jgi:CRP/FNR family transcriptional regulator, anaerobic regulatory protein